MATFVGGLRMRLISDNFFEMVRQALEDRHWFDSGRQHEPLELVRGEVQWTDPINVNTLAISDVDINDADLEMGSNYTEDTWTMYVDFYAESDSLGLDVAGDIRDILRGKIPSIGRSRPVLQVYDLTQDPVPPDPIFYCDIEAVTMDRSHNASRVQSYHWFSISCRVVDEFGDENDV